MHYKNMVSGTFLSRPNRFIAHVEIHGQEEICHVKNTGRCRELLPPGAQVWCQQADNPARKTRFDLITVLKGDRLINMDSQAPNMAAREWLLTGGLGKITNLKPETVLNCTPFVRQVCYNTCTKKWGVFLCLKEYQTNDTHQSSNKW